MVAKVLEKTLATLQVQVVIYKAVFHMVLLYGSNIWMLMGVVLKVPEVFHHQESRRIVEMVEQRMICGE